MLTAQIAAEYLEWRTKDRLKRKEQLLQRINNPRAVWVPNKNKGGRHTLSIGGVIDRIVPLVSPTPKPRNPNATICIAGPAGRRAIIPLLPGDSGKHDPRHARHLSQALRRARRQQTIPVLARIEPYPYFRYIVAKIQDISEFGDIHDLTEASDQLCQILWLAYNGNIDRDKYIPFPDLELSDFDKRDIYFRAFANLLDVEQFQKIRQAIEIIFQCTVFIEYAEGIAGVVRIYPVGNVDHLTDNPEWPTTGHGLTDLRFGFSTRGKVGKPIAYDIRRIFNNTHIMCLGATSSGKTNDIGGKLHQLKLMLEAKEILGTVVFADDGKRAAGLDMYEQKRLESGEYDDTTPGIKFARTPIEIKALLKMLHRTYLQRVEELAALKLANWPIGQTINGTKYTGLIAMFDEASVLLNEDWELDIKDPEAKEEITGGKKKPKGMKVSRLFTLWSQEWRAVGMMLILYVHQARAQEGVPTALTNNCLFKQCFALEDDDLAHKFFNRSAKLFSLPATRLKQGQFILKNQLDSMELVYGKTVRAPHTIEQDKLKAERGY